MKDLTQKELEVGDKVLLLAYRTSPEYIESNIGTIVGFTKCTVKIETDWSLYRHNNLKRNSYTGNNIPSHINKNSNYLIKL